MASSDSTPGTAAQTAGSFGYQVKVITQAVISLMIVAGGGWYLVQPASTSKEFIAGLVGTVVGFYFARSSEVPGTKGDRAQDVLR